MSSDYPTSVFRQSAGSRGQAIQSAHLAVVRARMRGMSVENRWIAAGLLLALVMLALLYAILVDNIAQVQNRRIAQQQEARDRHHCAMQQGRLERDQCLVALAQAYPQAAAPTRPDGDIDNAVVAQR